MKKTKYLFQESQPLLFPEETIEKEDYSRIPCDNIISQGAVKFLEKWPSHLYSTFLLGCFITSVILAFILITIFFSISAEQHRYRETRNSKQDSYNVYFMKHENRTWSRKELCYIETAAYKHPELNVYLINLVSADSQKNEDSIPIRFIDMKNFSSFSNFFNLYDQDKSVMISKDLSPEMLLRNKIANCNSNVRNIDIPTQQFFKGSILNNVYEKLNYETMEIAAKAYILWNYPGIALNPEMFNSINNIEKYFCKKNEKPCKPDQDFIIELQGDLQASSVSCHAFAEFLMKEIIRNRLSDQEHRLQKVLNDFCPRINNCPGVKIVNETSNFLTSETFCPTTSSYGAIK